MACQSSFGPAALVPKLRSVTAHTLCRRRPLFQFGNTRERLLHLSLFYFLLDEPPFGLLHAKTIATFPPPMGFKSREMYSQLIKRFAGISRVLFSLFCQADPTELSKSSLTTDFGSTSPRPTSPQKCIAREDGNL